MYKYLFGPVPSRRLGMSLGIDLVPKKVCTLDCVYCEVGKTTKLTLERKGYILYEGIIEELSDYFTTNPDPDYITFSGYGEPTLNLQMGEVIAFIKHTRPDIPIAVLTNGTLLYDPQVRKELMDADIVLPSLDAATEATFARINRPAPGLRLADCVQGLIDFQREFSGKTWLEVLILPGYNDSEEEIAALAKAIRKINPDSVQINTLDRPGTESGLRGATKTELRRVVDILALDNVEIIAAALKRKNLPAYRSDAENAILETIARRPCTLVDLTQILSLHVNEINKYLDVLDAAGKIEVVEQKRGVFYHLNSSNKSMSR
ncbi:MAG: radical SAM protein [Desulfuromonas sp.]|nr:radical SAM protein [Desulfuromonas sp.]